MAIDYTRPTPAPSGKISLTKDSPKVGLADQGMTSGIMAVNLNWTRAAAASTGRAGGLLGGLRGIARDARAAIDGSGDGIDLDLGCLWELRDGRRGVVQALGRQFGSLTRAPFLELDGDDRTGDSAAGETLRIDLSRAAEFRRILVFAYIYAGAPNWEAAQGRLSLAMGDVTKVDAKLDEYAQGARFCAALLLTSDGRSLSVSREMRYVNGSQRDLDRMYGWGLSWAAGSK